jgi:hypothetical protein
MLTVRCTQCPYEGASRIANMRHCRRSGRQVAPFFERLPSKAANPEYYKKIRLPLSLAIIEQKLTRNGYATLSALEGDFKRLVSNAKETNSRTSEIFGDAERIRKAVSNLMVKLNPAYKNDKYQAVATPLPATPGPDDDEDDEDAPGEEDVQEPAAPSSDADDDADGEPDDEEQEDEDALGEEEDEDEEDNEGDGNADPSPRARRGGRQRRTGRREKRTLSQTPKASRSSSSQQAKTDTQYENTAFQGLSFQQAQEKIVEDLLRKRDER